MRWLRVANLSFAVLVVAAPVAHVLELPNKLHLRGDLWLAVQQNLYRGWGPFIGAPSEIGALLTSALRALSEPRPSRRPLIAACFCYVGMLAAYFALNAPVNAAVAAWTAGTLPPDWPSYRARWEAGHALAALLATAGLAMLLVDRREQAQGVSELG